MSITRRSVLKAAPLVFSPAGHYLRGPEHVGLVPLAQLLDGFAMSPRAERIRGVIFHSTATPEGRWHAAVDVDLWHRQRGWAGIGYHFLIRLDGTIETGRPLTQDGAHARGWNRSTIGVAYVGGIDAAGRAKDTRTPEQKIAMGTVAYNAIAAIRSCVHLCGHRDLPGHATACPSFNTEESFPLNYSVPPRD